MTSTLQRVLNMASTVACLKLSVQYFKTLQSEQLQSNATFNRCNINCRDQRYNRSRTNTIIVHNTMYMCIGG